MFNQLKVLALSALAVSTIAVTSARADAIADGKKFFAENQCATCHSLTSKKAPTHTGPALYGVTKRPGRTQAWMVSWISDPDEMLKKDDLAKKLLKENNNVPMTAMLKLMTKKADGTPDTEAIKKKAEAIYMFLKDNDSKPEGGAEGAAAAPKKKG